ncbi:MAG: hypothetical protein K9H49_12910 [Bacteroidales bacterium]|nr:hypothetical protein [Bacteroidales bacterium]MCF8390411.1 hypothetical protein [Bacteroidales bacterium]
MDLKTEADKYFDGLLSRKERKKFIKEIKNNPEIKEYLSQRKFLEAKLSEYYAKEKNLNKEVEHDIQVYFKNYPYHSKSEKEFKDILASLSAPERKKRKISNQLLLNLAAALALLIIIGFGFANRFLQNKNQKKYLNLYAQFFEPDNDFSSDSIHFIGNESLSYSQLASFNSDIINEKFSNIVRSGTYDDISLVYLSVLLIKNGDEKLALSHLNEIMEFANSEVSDLARWYIALINLKVSEIDAAIENLTILCDGSSVYKEKACELLILIADK